jgi:hypothetical protein
VREGGDRHALLLAPDEWRVLKAGTMTYDEPNCSHDRLTPCSIADWAPCDRCHRLVCLIHDDLYEIFQSGELPYYAVDMICPQCVIAGWEQGEWTCGETAQWVNLR